MAVTVTTMEDVIEYPAATKWVIDGNECLHIVAEDGNVASYFRGVWLHVTRDMPASKQ